MQANRIRFELIYSDEICELGYKFRNFKNDLRAAAPNNERTNREYWLEK